jgi:hypothetical protein
MDDMLRYAMQKSNIGRATDTPKLELCKMYKMPVIGSRGGNLQKMLVQGKLARIRRLQKANAGSKSFQGAKTVVRRRPITLTSQPRARVLFRSSALGHLLNPSNTFGTSRRYLDDIILFMVYLVRTMEIRCGWPHYQWRLMGRAPGKEIRERPLFTLRCRGVQDQDQEERKIHAVTYTYLLTRILLSAFSLCFSWVFLRHGAQVLDHRRGRCLPLLSRLQRKHEGGLSKLMLAQLMKLGQDGALRSLSLAIRQNS